MKVWDIESTILKEVASHVRPGVTTLALNHLARQLMKHYNVASANKGYFPPWASEPYPYETCISVNDEIAHGIPSDRKLKEGDLVNIDLSIIKDGMAADAALTVPVGTISDADAELLHYAKKSLYAGIQRVHAGVRIEVIARAIEEMAWYKRFVVNCSMSGHGIGRHVHEEPAIYHARNPYYDNPELAVQYQQFMNIELQAGQIICLEPALTQGDKFGVPDSNGWTWRTKNGAKSGMFEEMLLVTETGYEILTSHLKEEHSKYLK